MSLIVDCFRRLTESPCKNELRGYKVTDVSRTRKFGVACRNLQELKRKACAKLNMTNDPAEVNVFLPDGSLIDEEYFHTLAPQTTLILQKPGEKVLSDADVLYDALRRVNIDFLIAGDRVAQFLTDNLKAKIAVLNSALNKDDAKTALSTRDEHPEWFQDLETNYTTKEAYMHRRCQDRIRGYLYKTIEQIKCSDVYVNDRRARQQLLRAIAFFKLQLKEDHYFGYYFDRSRAKSESAGRDETDFGRCYEHCPCNLGRVDENDDDDDEKYLRSSCTDDDMDNKIDETDARRLAKSEKGAKTTRDEEPTEGCPYRVKPREKCEQVAICDGQGGFRCEGRWNAEGCAYSDKHRINPYRSREELALFSTWNLDHKIERSRTLVPRLLQISLQDTINESDIYDCYDNLFTVKNLKLVHIICHDKGSHK